MHPVTCLVLALAALASAAPASTNNALANAIKTRQNCLFECLCDSPDDTLVASTGTCCASIGGVLDNGRCKNLLQEKITPYRSCCSTGPDHRGSTCFSSNGCRVPF